ncbi:T9SS type A sorting domain-containing protein [Hymenobacter coccineus]|uniref:T9SS type A sorting domain-containing protein n=1 Tax=Hymenobacter coccineus TaxID=1908235 RepID=UPI0009F57E33|nr:T9SS type A sorting domain-containing protein [Hymenobacter coccineus]
MQKNLNTHFIAFYSLSRRILSGSKAALMTAMALLLLTGFANQAKADSGFFKDYIIINGKYYKAAADGSDTSNPDITTAGNIGSFDRGFGNVSLGGEGNTYNDNGDDIQAAQLLYRVYRESTTVPTTFTPLSLAFQNVSGNNKKWSNTNNLPNLVASTNGPGRYVVELYFVAQGTYNNSGGSGSYNITDGDPNSTYKFTFDVTGSVPAQWTGNGESRDWHNAANWSPNGEPTDNTDVTIPYNANGKYPNVDYGFAQARTLRITDDAREQGNKLIELSGGELQVFGDFLDSRGGLYQSNGVFVLAGNTAQTFDGGSFYNFRVEGSSTKTLTSQMSIRNRLLFADTGGIVVTRTDNINIYGIDLDATAQISGESEVGYVLGVLRTPNRVVTGGQTNSFGNIGIDLIATGGDPGKTQVTRVTSNIYNGVGTSQSIRRSFTFKPDNPDNLTFSLVFHYLSAELNKISENNLVLFRSISAGGIPFAPLAKPGTGISTSAKTVTITGITNTLAALFTLGDATNPLPVTLTSFAAVAQGPNALLTWTTAQELNNAGFEVQVSTDGTTFSKLAFVAAASPNSSEVRTYQYRDATANKQGTRYYRLRQLDVDGKESLFAPQSLTFGGALAASVKGYPNPFASEINLALQTVAAGQATVSVLDGVGRQVRSWQPMLAAGASNLVLSDLASLPHGLYVVQVRYQDGQTQRLKVVKQ